MICDVLTVNWAAPPAPRFEADVVIETAGSKGRRAPFATRGFSAAERDNPSKAVPIAISGMARGTDGQKRTDLWGVSINSI